jgi:PAS domain S-box-containing protein
MTVNLPAAAPAATVLIVEDDPGIAELERGRLEETGYAARVAGTVEEALDEVRRGGVDLVLLDYRFPGELNGLDFYARAKAAGYDLPVILVTGFGNEATVIQALRVGVRDFVTKSVEYLDYLPEAVGRVLHQVGTERRLAESEARLAGVIQSAKDAVVVVESDRRVSLFNPAAERMFGCPAAAAVGRRITDFIPDEFGPLSGAPAGADVGSLSHRLRTGTRGVRAGGVEFPIEASVSTGAVGGRRFHTLVVRDVTERRRAEESLTLFRALIDRATDSIEVIDPATGRFVDVNETACRSHGYTRAEYLALGVPDVDPLVAARPWRAVVEERRRAGGGIVETRHRRKDGSTFPVEVSLGFVRLGREYMVAVVRDTTDRKRAEETLRRSEAQLRRAEAMAHVAGWTYEAAEGVYVSSEEGARICGYPPGAHTSEELAAGVHPDDRAAVRAALDGALAGIPFEIEHRLVVGGRVKWVSVRGEPEADAAGRVVRVLGVTQDVTDRRRLEEQFRQAQKMEAFGQLAGGVAHDFNNLLTIINGYADLLIESLPPGIPAADLAAEIHKAGARAAGLTAQLLAFGRRAVLDPRVVDPNAVVADMGKLLRRLIGEDVELATALGKGVSRVRVDPGQFGQVLMNLAVNARDAMPTGGKLTIETQDVVLDAEYARLHPGVAPGRYVMTAVADTGSGMAAEVRDRIFEPFFTTKSPGKGTGLGLATVYGIVKQSGGHLDVYSEVGTGSVFKVYLPAVGESAAGPAAGPGEVRGGVETVLLVEDQEEVRKFAALALRAFGYTVVPAPGGAEALQLVDRGEVRPDVLLTDVVMPGMSGRELAGRLWGRCPGLRVLFMSGYTDDAVVRHGVLGADAAFLQKPFTPLALARKLREVLDPPRREPG